MGILDFLGGGAGGILGNAPRSLFGPSQYTAEAERQGRTQVSVYQALKAAGVPDATAAAGALSPDVLKTISPAYFDTAPKLQDTGTNPLTGEKSFSIYEPNKKTLTPVGPSGPQPGGQPGGSMQQLFDKIEAGRQSGSTPDDLLKMLPATIRDAVGSMIQGKSIPQNFSIRGQARDMAVRLSHLIDPNFDETLIPQRQAFAKGMGSIMPSSFGGQVNSSGTIVKHLGDALAVLPTFEQGTLLGQSDTLNALNPVKDFIRSQSGDKKFLDARGQYDTAIKGIAGEMERLLSGSHGAEASKQYWIKRLSLDAPPTERRAALDEVKSLMFGRLSNVAQQKDRAYGSQTDPMSLLGPKEQEIAARLSTGRLNQPEAAPAAAFTPPAGWQFSKSRNQFRDTTGKIYDVNGNPL